LYGFTGHISTYHESLVHGTGTRYLVAGTTVVAFFGCLEMRAWTIIYVETIVEIVGAA
jgi:hypothetical protein